MKPPKHSNVCMMCHTPQKHVTIKVVPRCFIKTQSLTNKHTTLLGKDKCNSTTAMATHFRSINSQVTTSSNSTCCMLCCAPF